MASEQDAVTTRVARMRASRRGIRPAGRPAIEIVDAAAMSSSLVVAVRHYDLRRMVAKPSPS
jgi:hypothetical protein